MHSHLPSITIDVIEMKFIQQLNKHLEVTLNHIKSIKTNSNLTNNFIIQIRTDVHQRYEIRNNYYHRKFPLVLHDLCLIKSTKTHFLLIEKQHYHSKQFFKKIFNIQLLTNIEQYDQQSKQSNKCLNELKNILDQYEYDINQLKEKLIEQYKQMKFYSNKLFQIQYEQNQIQSNIQRLKQEIQFEKELFIWTSKFTLKTEDINLSTQMTQMKFNIEQQSIDLLLLQFQLYIYCTILNTNDSNYTKSDDQPLLVPTTSTKEIRRQSAPLINKLNENIIRLNQQQLPIESTSKPECIKFKSRKSNIFKYSMKCLSN